MSSELRVPSVDSLTSAGDETETTGHVPASRSGRDERLVVIRPARRLPRLDVRELWHYRELFATLVWRDIAVRYKQTSIGAAWAILQPFLLMVVMTIVFGKFAKFDSDGVPYPIFNYSGLLPWMYFTAALSLASVSVVGNVNLVTKVYFPRLILPGAAVLVPLVDFLIASSVMAAMWVYFDTYPGIEVVLAPVFLLLALGSALGVALFLAALNVRFRDVPYAIPFLIQFWFWLTPVAYSTRNLEEWQQLILSLNPMSGVITGFRWTIIGTAPPDPLQFVVSIAATVLVLAGGLVFFRYSEPRFADTI